jgi:hypothetical protein
MRRRSTWNPSLKKALDGDEDAEEWGGDEDVDFDLDKVSMGREGAISGSTRAANLP